MIVVSRKKDYHVEGGYVVHSPRRLDLAERREESGLYYRWWSDIRPGDWFS
jgi:hypothetical protein